ncbi:DUF1629 domain-containing protein [Bradyrhizobium jicamae]|uniref:imm11 family protein n=1 Tax=Bradyrhizobium jicamae TaxID=280332 RepID=UPI001BAC9E3C|nr:DUF1629 domain-containing protein [Bradyrhizobium jicamae]MBR0756566.1 DUF1629 domain-containing protein [Bradyrhizobium jicamae]
MADRASNSIANRTKAHKRRFYEISSNYRREAAPGFYLQDESVIKYEVDRLSEIAEQPCYVFDKSAGALPQDLEEDGAFWLVSDRAKVVFEAVDPGGFVFLPCAVRVPRGVWEGPRYWLCEVVRVLDALDEVHSRFVKIGIGDDPSHRDFGKKFYNFSMRTQLVFDEERVGDARAFRMAYYEYCVICNQDMKDACKRAGLKGILFRDVLKSAY